MLFKQLVTQQGEFAKLMAMNIPNKVCGVLFRYMRCHYDVCLRGYIVYVIMWVPAEMFTSFYFCISVCVHLHQ